MTVQLYSNGWEKGTRNSRQLQEVIYTVSDATVKSYEIGQTYRQLIYLEIFLYTLTIKIPNLH